MDPIVMPWIKCEDLMPMPEFTVLAVLCEQRPDYTTKFPYAKKLRRCVVRAQWIPRHTREGDDDEFRGELDHDDVNGGDYWPEGWYEHNEQEETSWMLSGKVSHWCPLPALPEIPQSQSAASQTATTAATTPG